ncbi:MAG TPA: TlyA family RNA methyltransferase [Firmicutes bacterium]|nr:TlyA family RNA methyltransferase [Bacillota bacterium]
MKQERRRLDQLLVERGLFPSRERARGAIMAGLVEVDGRRADKPGTPVAPEAAIQVRGETLPYVSRGGLKLAKALEVFGIRVEGRVAIDVGASTGGFTDVLLRHGARLVYAVDVGYGQLAWKLRQDPRVVVLERTNIRHLNPALLPEAPDLATVDTAFISVRVFLGHLLSLLRHPADLVTLVKPQFEAGRAEVGKKGVVRQPAVHRRVLVEVAEAAAARGAYCAGLSFSPVAGPEGNLEFLMHLRTGDGGTAAGPAPLPPGLESLVAKVVEEAHLAVGRAGKAEPRTE